MYQTIDRSNAPIPRPNISQEIAPAFQEVAHAALDQADAERSAAMAQAGAAGQKAAKVAQLVAQLGEAVRYRRQNEAQLSAAHELVTKHWPAELEANLHNAGTSIASGGAGRFIEQCVILEYGIQHGPQLLERAKAATVDKVAAEIAEISKTIQKLDPATFAKIKNLI